MILYKDSSGCDRSGILYEPSSAPLASTVLLGCVEFEGNCVLEELGKELSRQGSFTILLSPTTDSTLSVSRGGYVDRVLESMERSGLPPAAVIGYGATPVQVALSAKGVCGVVALFASSRLLSPGPSRHPVSLLDEACGGRQGMSRRVETLMCPSERAAFSQELRSLRKPLLVMRITNGDCDGYILPEISHDMKRSCVVSIDWGDFPNRGVNHMASWIVSWVTTCCNESPCSTNN